MATTDIAFTPAVKAVQERRGSRAPYAKVEARGGWQSEVTPDLASFLAERDSLYLATASADGRPYIQHRGGPEGFLRVLGPKTLGFADYRGNRQYISTGNLAENDQAFLFLMDYAARRRVKIWGRARVVETDAALVAALMPDGYEARPEQAILFEIEAWDVNCPQHIPRKLGLGEVQRVVADLQGRLAALQAENAALRTALDRAPPPSDRRTPTGGAPPGPDAATLVASASSEASEGMSAQRAVGAQ